MTGPLLRPVARLIEGSVAAGVFTATPGSGPELAANLRTAGRRVGVAPVAAGRRELLAAIAGALDFPDYFGHNLDALWDCLEGLAEPTVLILTGPAAFAAERPADWTRVLEVLAERAELDPHVAPPFAVVLA